MTTPYEDLIRAQHERYKLSLQAEKWRNLAAWAKRNLAGYEVDGNRPSAKFWQGQAQYAEAQAIEFERKAQEVKP